MSSKTSPSRPLSNRKRRRSLWWLLIPAALVAALLLPGSPLRTQVETLKYGEFKNKLLRGEVRSVKVGPSEITGELKTGLTSQASPFRTSRIGMEHDEQLAQQLQQNLPDGSYDADPGPLNGQASLIPALLMAALILGLFVFIMRKGGVGSAMAFARSRHRLYSGDSIRVTFDDVAGIDEAVAELREVVGFLRTPEKYLALGGRIPKGVLLVGPPGTGKTLLARAVAGEAGVPFFSLSGSDFVEMFVGVGAARARNLFAQAQAQAPCLIFIDELDALGKARSGGGAGSHDERDQTLNQLLVELDGFDSNLGVIVMGASNRPETLDSALIRPGRFDRTIVVDRPDLGGREQILRVHTKKVPISDEINLRHLAAMTPGFVGADLANLVNEAALLAARKGKDRVDRVEFEEGVERVLAGPEKKQRVIRPDEKQRIAYHEAGHALVARSLPDTDPVHKISIIGRGAGMGGYTLYRPEDDRFLHTQSRLEQMICTLLGGTISEELAYGEISDGATSDLQRATQIARKMVAEFGMSPTLGRVSYQTEGRSPFLPGGGANDATWSEQTAREIDLEVRRLIDQSLDRTRAILTHRRAALDQIAAVLCERESIDSAELQAVLDRHPYEPCSAGQANKESSAGVLRSRS